jgi:hypothetical protein
VDDTADLYVALAKNASMTGQVMAVGKCFTSFSWVGRLLTQM